MKVIAISDSAEEIEKLSKDVAFEKISVDTVNLINECTGIDIDIPAGKEYIDMCKGLVGYGENKKAEGRAEGRVEDIRNMLLKGKTAEQIADFCGYDLNEVKKVEAEMTVSV